MTLEVHSYRKAIYKLQSLLNDASVIKCSD